MNWLFTSFAQFVFVRGLIFASLAWNISLYIKYITSFSVTYVVDICFEFYLLFRLFIRAAVKLKSAPKSLGMYVGMSVCGVGWMCVSVCVCAHACFLQTPEHSPKFDVKCQVRILESESQKT